MVFDNGFRALDKVSVRAEPGQFVTLLGPSGCGKTTLLRLIAGFLSPTEGSVVMDGTDVGALPPEKRDTAMVFQSYALFPHMTVEGNITFGLKQKKLPKSEQRERVDDALSYVSLESQRDKRPAALSGGQQQRVALARAMAMRPAVILYDEPLSNLDAKLREQVRFELRRLQRDYGFTAIYVTHDQAEALAMSDVIYLMNEGKIVQSGPPEKIYNHPTNRFVADFLGVANVFEATVLSSEGTRHQVDTPFGKLDVESDAAPAASRIYMCWRPEDARLVADLEGINSFELKVTESVFLGNLTDVFGHLPGAPDETFRVQFLQFGRAADSGESMQLSIAPEHLRFLEPVE